MLIDTHCHLTDEKIDDVKSAIAEAKEVGVTTIIIPGTSIEDSKRAVVLAEQESLYALVGVHPEEVEKYDDLARVVGELDNLIENSRRVVGFGEIGLDFYSQGITWMRGIVRPAGWRKN